jgi:hypothetical protein
MESYEQWADQQQVTDLPWRRVKAFIEQAGHTRRARNEGVVYQRLKLKAGQQ